MSSRSRRSLPPRGRSQFLGRPAELTMSAHDRDPSRRGFLRRAAALGGGAALRFQARAPHDGLAKTCRPTFRRGAARSARRSSRRPYGVPSKYEANVQRRESPGLTRTPQSSVSFTPLQNLFGIITPSGLHFERHHAGMPDIDPHEHRLMIHGLVAEPADLHDGRPHCAFRRCRASTSSSAAPTPAWSGATSPCRPCSTRTACSAAANGPACCSSTLLDECGHRPQDGEVRPRRGRRRRVADAHDPDRDGAGRRDRRLRPERRDAAARAGLSAAPRRARRAGRVERQVAAPHQGRRPAVEHARGVAALRRPACPAASTASTRGSRKRRA